VWPVRCFPVPSPTLLSLPLRSNPFQSCPVPFFPVPYAPLQSYPIPSTKTRRKDEGGMEPLLCGPFRSHPIHSSPLQSSPVPSYALKLAGIMTSVWSLCCAVRSVPLRSDPFCSLPFRFAAFRSCLLPSDENNASIDAWEILRDAPCETTHWASVAISCPRLEKQREDLDLWDLVLGSVVSQ